VRQALDCDSNTVTHNTLSRHASKPGYPSEGQDEHSREIWRRRRMLILAERQRRSSAAYQVADESESAARVARAALRRRIWTCLSYKKELQLTPESRRALRDYWKGGSWEDRSPDLKIGSQPRGGGRSSRGGVMVPKKPLPRSAAVAWVVARQPVRLHQSRRGRRN